MIVLERNDLFRSSSQAYIDCVMTRKRCTYISALRVGHKGLSRQVSLLRPTEAERLLAVFQPFMPSKDTVRYTCAVRYRYVGAAFSEPLVLDSRRMHYPNNPYWDLIIEKRRLEYGFG